MPERVYTRILGVDEPRRPSDHYNAHCAWWERDMSEAEALAWMLKLRFEPPEE